MLKKCLKYDLQAIGRVWWILAVIMMGAALIAALGFRAMFQVTFDPNSEGFIVFLSIIGFLAGILSIFGMIAGLTVSVILVYWRTYTNFYTDEGYLTFTLPVTTHQILLSSFLNTIIGELIMLVAVCLSVGIAVLLFLAAFPENLIWPDVSVGLKEAFSQMWSSLAEHMDVLASLAGTGIISVLS